MVTPLNIKITGVNETLNKLKTNFDKAKMEIDNEMAATMVDIVTMAKSNVPANLGQLRASINEKKNRELSYTIKVDVDYGQFIEFGTGDFAASYLSNKEDEWKKYAFTFYENGKGRTPARPYLYPSLKYNLKRMMVRFRQVINKYERL